MSVRSGQSITATFTTRALGAGATDATGTPTGTLYVNGTANGASVTVTNITTGIYKFAVTLPTLAFGDVVEMLINATVSSITDNARVWIDTKDVDVDSSGIVSSDAKKINAVATTSVTTVSANVGTTQPVNFTGTSTTAYVKTDMIDIAGAAISTSSAQIGVNVVSYAAGVGPLSPIRTGTCQSGSTSTTIKFDSGASSTASFYNNCGVYTTGGTGAGQFRKILSYVGSTTVTATVRAWITTPDNTTTFAILPDASVWDDVTADHQTAGSTGFTLNAGGNPWATALPGAFASGTAGHIIGNALPDSKYATTGGLHILGANVGDTTYTGVSNAAMTYTGASGVPAVQMSGVGNNAVGLQIDGGGGTASAGLVVLGKQVGLSVNASAGSGVTFAGTTFSFNMTGAVSATSASNDIRLGTTEEGVIAGAVWDVVIASHLTSGTTGKALNSASTAGDPWATALPGAYSSGTAGFIVGTNLDAKVTTRLAPTVAARTLDVTATGGAGIDWANVENPTTTLVLSGTTINAVTTVTVPTAAEIATAWGASVIGNSRTRDMFLQGMTNKVAFEVPGAGQYTIYQTDDTTPLKVGSYTAAAVDPVVSLDPA